MKKEYILLKELSELNGVSSNELSVSKYIKTKIEGSVDEIKSDNLGSLVGIKNGNGPKIMIAGHMDEIGLIVTQITKEGFIKFHTIGGWYSQVMLAQVWQIHTKKGIVIGITGVKPPHIIPMDQRNVAVKIDSMYLDIGVASKDEAENLGIRIGDTITPYTEFRVLGNEKYLLGKAWDNRIGSAVVIEVLKRLENHPNSVYGTFTVQEEVGLRGARTSSNMVVPDIAIALDSGLGNDAPGGDPENQSLGKGPQILIFDGGLIGHRKFREFVIDVAKRNNIPYQEAFISGGGTDAGAMHQAHIGAPALSICIPTRYMHSHTSIIHYDDYENTIKLILALILELDEKKVKEITFD